MKNINELLTESTEWYVPYMDLFQKHADDILKSGGIRGFSNPKVKHYGSKSASCFYISYKNHAGVSVSYGFNIPTTSKIPSVGANSLPKNAYVNELINKNLNKLPKLEFDRLGNVIV